VTKSGFTPSIRAADANRVGASGRASLRIRTANNVVTMAQAKKSVKDLPAGALKGKKVSLLYVLYACYMRFDAPVFVQKQDTYKRRQINFFLALSPSQRVLSSGGCIHKMPVHAHSNTNLTFPLHLSCPTLTRIEKRC